MFASVLLLAACSLKEPTAPSVTETETNPCGNVLGTPDEWDADQKVSAKWMVDNHGYTTQAECLSIPLLRIRSYEDGEWPLSRMDFTIASYDNGDWVQRFNSPLTVSTTEGDLDPVESIGTGCVLGFCGPTWEIDLSEAGPSVSPAEDLYVQFSLPTFDDPSEIDELWDDEEDRLLIWAWVDHSWMEDDGTYQMYGAGSTTTMEVELLSE